MHGRTKAILLVVLVCFEVLFLSAFFLPIFVHRRADVEAFVQYQKSPTPESQAGWIKERIMTEHDTARIRNVEAALAVGNLLLIGCLFLKRTV